jgi:hypothetical protein
MLGCCMSIIAPGSFGPLADATLQSIAWAQDGPHLEIGVEHGTRDRRFRFTWVNRLNISLSQSENEPLSPMTWESNAEPRPDGRIGVIMDFAGQGKVSFECQEIDALGE